MKPSLLLLILATVSSQTHADDFCMRLPMDPESPPSLDGHYDLLGKDPTSGKAYLGTLTVSTGKEGYALTRTVQGKRVKGDGWIEQCGDDKIIVLNARYFTRPTTELLCSLSMQGDNYYRITCKVRQGPRQEKGLEAWFQQP